VGQMVVAGGPSGAQDLAVSYTLLVAESKKVQHTHPPKLLLCFVPKYGEILIPVGAATACSCCRANTGPTVPRTKKMLLK